MKIQIGPGSPATRDANGQGVVSNLSCAIHIEIHPFPTHLLRWVKKPNQTTWVVPFKHKINMGLTLVGSQFERGNENKSIQMHSVFTDVCRKHTGQIMHKIYLTDFGFNTQIRDFLLFIWRWFGFRDYDTEISVQWVRGTTISTIISSQ